MPRSRDRRRFEWLDLRDRGTATGAIARRYGVPQRTIQHEIGLAAAEVAATLAERARLPMPRLVLSFPIDGFTPHSRCRHHLVEIPRGSVMCCAVCHRSGIDHHPALQRHRTDPRPDRAAQPEPSHGTRRQRRAGISDQPGRAGRVQAA